MSVAHAEPRTTELDPARQFDFWLGEWDCTWSDEAEWHAGTNSVYLDLGDKVVVESFDARPSLDARLLLAGDCPAGGVVDEIPAVAAIFRIPLGILALRLRARRRAARSGRSSAAAWRCWT